MGSMYDWKGDEKLDWKKDFPLKAPAVRNVADLYRQFVRSTQKTLQYSSQNKSKLDFEFKQNLSSKSVLESFIEQFFQNK